MEWLVKKIIPKASNFLVFPIQLKIAIIIHKKIIEGTAITAPTENISFVFIKLPNKNKQGKIKILNDINQGTYIQKKSDTVYSILKAHIKQKFNDGITKGSAYSRDKESLKQMLKTCKNFINKPIQKVTLKDIQIAKENLKISLKLPVYHRLQFAV